MEPKSLNISRLLIFELKTVGLAPSATEDAYLKQTGLWWPQVP